MSGPSHVPKIITDASGKQRVVYVRSPETEDGMEKIRLGPLYELRPLELPGIDRLLERPSLLVQAPYMTARRLVRTRVDFDRSSHRVLSGTMLLGEYFHANESCRSGFPQVEQLFLLFGYIEAINRFLHQVLCETIFTRYELDLHCWLLFPLSIEEMAVKWGDAFLNFKMFPFFKLDGPVESHSPVSVAQSVPVPGESHSKKHHNSWVRDASYPEQGDDLSAPTATQGDPKFDPPKKKRRGFFP